MKNEKTYLVTGGTGFLGRSLVKSLVVRGNKVRVLDNNSRGQLESLADIQEKIDFIDGDIRDPKCVERACAGVDSVCHLAYVNGTEFFYQKPDLVLDVGIKGMVNLMDQMIQQKIPELMLMSSSEVYQVPPSVPTNETVPLVIPDILNPRYSYGGGKILSELMAINYGRKYLERVLIVRPHNVFGPQMGWEHVVPQFCLRLHQLAKGARGNHKTPFPIQGSGQETRAFVYIDDFTNGVLTVLDNGQHLNIYHVGTDEEKTISDVAIELAKFFEIEIQIKPGELTKGSPLRRCPDISKVGALGYKPKISFAEGMNRTAKWYRENASLAPAK